MHSLAEIGKYLYWYGEFVDTGHWQAVKNVPQTKTKELQNVSFSYGIPTSIDYLQSDLNPNLPWAEDHFLERVGGDPLNPGMQYRNWPWYRGNVETHKQPGQFSHSYMERFWPRSAGDRPAGVDEWDQSRPNQLDRMGIRYRYGDLNDVVALLAREPYTRQAVLPVFFPEDTGAHHGQRIPCTLYYHFMMREGELGINYTIRSCDFLRHFRDDAYMAARLCQWVLDELQNKHNTVSQDEGFDWDGVIPGTLTMLMHSLHIFEGDMPKMRREYG
jgi:hypothetical protein